jgi:hypothetical protein
VRKRTISYPISDIQRIEIWWTWWTFKHFNKRNGSKVLPVTPTKKRNFINQGSTTIFLLSKQRV